MISIKKNLLTAVLHDSKLSISSSSDVCRHSNEERDFCKYCFSVLFDFGLDCGCAMLKRIFS